MRRFLNLFNKKAVLIIFIVAITFVASGGLNKLNYLASTALSYLENTFFSTNEEVKEIEIKSDGYDNGEDGSFIVNKSADWIGTDSVLVDFDVETVLKAKHPPMDVIIVVDNSGSMVGDKLDYAKRDMRELTEYVLKTEGNKVSVITFSSEAEVYTELTDNKEALITHINEISPFNGTDYYEALVALEKALDDYKFVEGRELIVLFLTDGYPTESTPLQKAQYMLLKEKHPYVRINGIQYEMGVAITPELKEVTDMQYSASLDSLNNTLFEAVYLPEYYEKFEIVDYINHEYFYLESINDVYVTMGTVTLTEENGVQKITWSLGENEFRSGKKASMTIKLKLKQQYVGGEGFYPTNEGEEIYTKLPDEEEKEIIEDDVPVLKSGYTVSYDANLPSDCKIDISMPDEVRYAYQTVALPTNSLSCEGYQFKGWEPATEVVMVNDDYYIMPSRDVVVRAKWTKIDLEKSVNGTIYEKLNLYETIANQAELDNTISAYVLNLKGIDFSVQSSDVNGKGIYTVASTKNDTYPIHYYRGDVDNNNVIFGNYCWKIIRTTETGGVKLIYNGVPDDSGRCKNTGTAAQLFSSSYSYEYDSPAYVGYMYNIAKYRTIGKSVKTSKTVALKLSTSSSDNYYYSNAVTYNSSSRTYTLEEPNRLVYSDSYSSLGGMYRCSNGNATNCSTVYYIHYTDSSNIYYSSIYNGAKISTGPLKLGQKYSYDSVNDIALLEDYIEVSVEEYVNNYSNYVNYYVCDDDRNASCSNIRKINSTTSNSYSATNLFVYGNDVTWTNGEYTLEDTKIIDDYTNKFREINNYHYTCFNLSGVCETVKFIYHYYPNYVELSDGKDINDAMYDMFSAPDVNTKNSNLKSLLESWYEANLLDYDSYIEDTVYCNDRTIYEANGWDPNGGNIEDYLLYKSYYRVFMKQTPILSCPRTLDSFSTTTEIGNGRLKYKIGTLTADEVMYAGGRAGVNNKNYYLYTGNTYFTLTPFDYGSDGSQMVYVTNNGSLSWDYVDYRKGVRPVISLKSKIDYSGGDGSSSNPYVIIAEAITS